MKMHACICLHGCSELTTILEKTSPDSGGHLEEDLEWCLEQTQDQSVPPLGFDSVCTEGRKLAQQYGALAKP